MPSVDALDVAIVHAFRRGDDDAVRAVYTRYAGLVFSVSMHILRDRPLAEEATQQTFVQAWRASRSFDGERDLAPWLATIARRVAIDIVRREGRRPSTPLEDADPNDAALVSLPPNETKAWEVAQVRLAIDALPPDERDVVRLQHLEGYTHVEIAERLGIAVGTVKSRSFRAHRALADHLAFLREESA
jgi:RNA polymerase sigma-70 factor (ECF subfamily)